MAAAAVVRFAILIHAQTHVHSDEAIIGLMGKHILEGKFFPFYMYGQDYNAAAAWEAYLAVIPYSLFGVGVVPLKAGIVVLSLATLVAFYAMTQILYGRSTAIVATVLFALSPSLLKWHFQVRGYSWYFLSIPILTALFFAIEARTHPRRKLLFLFGLAAGLSLWSLELVLIVCLALWGLLALRRRWSLPHAATAVAGFVVGYAPAIVFNITHHFVNWTEVFVDKSGGTGLFNPSTYVAIFVNEMPKFFGPDTTLWYYPETSAIGYAFYAIALAAIGLAIAPFVKHPKRLYDGIRGELALSDEKKDLVMLALTVASFVPYVVAPVRVPGYFLGGCVFLSVLAGRLLVRAWSSPKLPVRIAGGLVLALAAWGGLAAIVETGRRNQIETLSLNSTGGLDLTRFPGADIDGVERHLRDHRIDSVWATVSFVYPLLFESGETLAVSDKVFGGEQEVYPNTVVRRQPSGGPHQVFVLESASPLRAAVVGRCTELFGAPPAATEYGSLVVIEAQRRP